MDDNNKKPKDNEKFTIKEIFKMLPTIILALLAIALFVAKSISTTIDVFEIAKTVGKGSTILGFLIIGFSIFGGIQLARGLNLLAETADDSTKLHWLKVTLTCIGCVSLFILIKSMPTS